MIQAISSYSGVFAAAHAFALNQPPQFPHFEVITSAIVPGNQTVARRELFAFFRALQAAHTCAPQPRIQFVTDAQYLMNVVFAIEHPVLLTVCPMVANFDIIDQTRPVGSPCILHEENRKPL